MESVGKSNDIIKQMLTRSVLLADQVIKVTEDAAAFKHECSDLNSKASKLVGLLHQAARSSASLYDRPTRRIIAETEQVLEKALSLSQKCRGNGLLKRTFTVVRVAAFRKTVSQLENSLSNLSWLLRVSCGRAESNSSNEHELEADDNNNEVDFLGLPPIAANDLILCLIWEQISIVSTGQVEDRANAASSLATLARDSVRHGKLIVEEGGVGPLCKLLKEGANLSSVEAQENAARALGLLACDAENVAHMVNSGVCAVLAKVLRDGLVTVQATVAWTVAELAARYPKCQEIFAQHNVVRILIGHLVFETVLPEHMKYVVPTKTAVNRGGAGRSTRLRAVVARLQAQTTQHGYDLYDYDYGNGNGNVNGELLGEPHPEREVVDPQVKERMKAMSARALCHLVKGNSVICRTVCESRALLCFAALLETGTEEVSLNSAMALLEITSVAEKDSELRRAVFKPSYPACKAVVDQMLKIIGKGDSWSTDMLIPCIKSIGNLARTFKATETRMITPLVHLLDEREAEVSREAAVALTKFANTENYLHVDRSKAIIEAGGVKHLVQLVYFGEKIVQIPALELLTYVALHDPDSEELAKCEVLSVLLWALKQAHLLGDEAREYLLLEAKSRVEVFQSRV